jgi:hypothetical protein
MPDVNQFVSAVETLLLKYGIVGGIIMLLAIGVLVYVIERLKQDARIPAEKILEEIRMSLRENFDKLMERYKKEIQLLFRDEELRKSILQTTISESDRIRLETYKRVYRLFFDVLFGITELRKIDQAAEKTKRISTMYDAVNEVRKDIFVNSAQMGRLTDFLLHAQIALWDDLRKAQETTASVFVPREYSRKLYDASEELQKAERWIRENMKTAQTVKDVELSEEFIDKLKSERDGMIGAMLETP